MLRPLLISALLTSTALAETWTVDDDGKADFDNIQAAVDAASDGDEIIVMPGTYTSTNEKVFVINAKDLILRSKKGPEETIIDGESTRTCGVSYNAFTTIEGFTFNQGYSISDGGGLIIGSYGDTSNLCQINDCIFIENKVNGTGSGSNDATGGAIEIYQYLQQGIPTTVSVTDCTFINNSAKTNGGAIGAGGKTELVITNSYFEENSANGPQSKGGAIFSFGSAIDIINCTFANNQSNHQGGSVYLDSNAPKLNASILNSNFINNNSKTSSGGGLCCYGYVLEVSDSSFLKNTTSSQGGGAYFGTDQLTLTNSIFEQNMATYGGGLYVQEPSIITNCQIRQNAAKNGGGGLWIEYKEIANISDTLLCSNTPDQIWGTWNDDGNNQILEICQGDDSDGDGILDSKDNCYLYNPDQADCNGNGIGDVCDVADSTSFDCDQNNVPDECQPDCDGDGFIDACDNNADVDGDGIPDNCEEDCNGNTIPDDFEIELGLVQDCNENGVPDECDIADGTVDDCNGNNILDSCDIADGTEEDCNENGVLDSCDVEEILQLEEDLIGSDVESGDYFGSSVCIENDRAFIGAIGDDDYTGAVYVYKLEEDVWVEDAKIIASDGAGGTWGDNFGTSVACSNDTLVVGTIRSKAYVFRYDGSEWVEETKLLASDGTLNDQFGKVVDIDGNKIIVGAYQAINDGISTGAAYIFEYLENAWVEKIKLVESDPEYYSRFGESVAIRNNTAIVGKRSDDENSLDSGAAYIFRLNGSQWTEEVKLVGDNSTTHLDFGRSVEIFGDRVVISALTSINKIYDGYTYIYSFDGTSWNQEFLFIENDITGAFGFGQSIALHNNILVVGAYGHYASPTHQGTAFVYNISEPDGSLIANLHELIDLSEPYSFYSLGYSVSISDSSIIAGAIGDSNGGSAFIFSEFTNWDCNTNEEVDSCEIEEDPSLDCDGDGLPDSCAIEIEDCNDNGIPDNCDLEDPANDQDNNGVLDECECIGDADLDGYVNVNDLLIIIGYWGNNTPQADLNFDGIVDVTDLLIVISNWGPCE
jgi:predicted outer membrane repeat protein